MANTLKFGDGKWATGEGTALAFNDENENFKPLPFTFTRNSTATVVNESGLIEEVGNDVPRIDFKDNTKGALLLEPSRTNLIPNSFLLSNSPIKNGTITDNFAISPDGTQNASRLTSPSIDPFFYQGITFSTGSYTASIYVKGIGSSIGKELRIVLGGISSAKYTISSEWTRFEYTATMTSGYANSGIEIPDPAVIGDDVLVWGWQIEAGSYATSYIPTSGSAVTRVAEKCENNLSNVVSLTEGVIYIDTTNLGNDGTSSNIISQNSVVDTVYCLKAGSNNKLACGLFASGVNIPINSTSAFPLGTRTKIAFHYKSGNSKLYVNGSLEGTNGAAFTLGSGFATALRLIDTASAYNAFPQQSIAREFKVYNNGLTEAELIALTTI